LRVPIPTCLSRAIAIRSCLNGLGSIPRSRPISPGRLSEREKCDWRPENRSPLPARAFKTAALGSCRGVSRTTVRINLLRSCALKTRNRCRNGPFLVKLRCLESFLPEALKKIVPSSSIQLSNYVFRLACRTVGATSCRVFYGTQTRSNPHATRPERMAAPSSRENLRQGAPCPENALVGFDWSDQRQRINASQPRAFPCPILRLARQASRLAQPPKAHRLLYHAPEKAAGLPWAR